MSEKIEFSLKVNGTDFSIACPPRKTLADALREDCRLTGTHVGCEHGVCGACTVVVDGRAVRACLMFAVQAQGSEVRTVEGLAQNDVLSPLQQAFIDNHALQCGFCTPGFLMLINGAFERDPDICEDELTELLSSNLCRCTGYRNIARAVLQVADKLKARSELAVGKPS
ncbi:MAG: carbon-monoxide dehydrogenase small subunit [Rhodobacteraceae bacterium HLUCCA12]|nr:MAG: carbon-monoxide dehydrogenase small subunit [Rhodobacteraceae bacterium HLUCCA12]